MEKDLISRTSLLKGIGELKQSPWFNRGRCRGDMRRVNQEQWILHKQYLERKEAVEVIVDLCINKEPLFTSVPAKPMLDLIEHIQMMLTTIYDTGGCIQSQDMKCLIGAADRLKEYVKGAAGND